MMICNSHLVSATLPDEIPRNSPLTIFLHHRGNDLSMADFFLSNVVSYWITIYLPSGTPGNVSVYVAALSLLDLSLPSGIRTDSKELFHCCNDTFCLKICAASFQLSEYSPESIALFINLLLVRKTALQSKSF